MALVGKRGQAALFDGITFLLFTTGSIALMYAFLSSYGVAQDNTMRSAYALAYVNDIAKTIFYVDASKLGETTPVAGTPATDPRVLEKNWADPECNSQNPLTDPKCKPYLDLDCSRLSNYRMSTVADLLKKDLEDGSDPAGNEACLDNKMGHPGTGSSDPRCTTRSEDWSSVPDLQGTLATRCLMKEVMKPFHYAGYKYFVDVMLPSGSSVLMPDGAKRITNHANANIGNWRSCNDAVPEAGGRLLSIVVPFRVSSAVTIREIVDFRLRVCIWPSKSPRTA